MKKQVFVSVLILFSLLLLSIVSSVEIQISKEVYYPGETLQGEIHGNFPDGLKKENLYLFRERSLPTIYGLIKYQEKYLFYMSLPETTGNYTVQITDATYTLGGETSTDTVTKEFQIQSVVNESSSPVSFWDSLFGGKTSEKITFNNIPLSILPGFIVSNDDFSLTIRSLGETQEVYAELEENQDTRNFTLGENQEKTIYFSTSFSEFTKTNLQINNYNLPVFIYPIINSQPPENPNINDSNEHENNTINDSGMTLEEYNDLDSINDSETPEIILTEQTCSELNGVICSQNNNEVCDGTPVISQEQGCCQGICRAQESKSYLWLIGLIILLIIAGGVGFFFWDMKKKQKNLSENKVQEKMFGVKKPGEEVRRNIRRY